MIKVEKNTKKTLLDIYESKNICLEGNVLKIIDIDGEKDKKFLEYINTCIDRDKSVRVKRLEVTKKVQKQNLELKHASKEIERINKELILSLEKTEQAKVNLENDLDILQKKTQFELINIIVRMSIFVVIGIAILTTAVYAIAIFSDKDTSVLGSTWSNVIGIILTNSFSIIGTIMGVKYVSDRKEKK